MKYVPIPHILQFLKLFYINRKLFVTYNWMVQFRDRIAKHALNVVEFNYLIIKKDSIECYKIYVLCLSLKIWYNLSKKN